jgi:hypothetical protein
MSALAGDFPHFEEAARALFANDLKRLAQIVDSGWKMSATMRWHWRMGRDCGPDRTSRPASAIQEHSVQNPLVSGCIICDRRCRRIRNVIQASTQSRAAREGMAKDSAGDFYPSPVVDLARPGAVTRLVTLSSSWLSPL